MVVEITKITIVPSVGTDKLFLHTNLPDGCWPYTGTSTLRVEVVAGGGLKYCSDNFPGVPIES